MFHNNIIATAKRFLRRDYRVHSALPVKAVPQVAPETTEKISPKRWSNNKNLLWHIYPEFLPDPKPNWRNSLREKLERADMLKRRTRIDVPEFYVGSIVAVTTSDSNVQSRGKTNRVLGICIERLGCGLSAQFTLRNVVESQGIEVRYELYDPTIQKIQVLRLQKRLDKNLLYLRDALPEYSTFPMNMDPETLPEGTPVPLNPIQVRLKPKPWLERWERKDLKGVSNMEEHLRRKDRVRRDLNKRPWEKYDLMKQYRETISEEEQNEIWSDVCSQLQQLQLTRKKMSRKPISTFSKTQYSKADLSGV